MGKAKNRKQKRLMDDVSREKLCGTGVKEQSRTEATGATNMTDEWEKPKFVVKIWTRQKYRELFH